MDNQENTGGILANIEQAGGAVLVTIEHPFEVVARLAQAARDQLEKAGAAVEGEAHSLVHKVRAYFHSTSTEDLQTALAAMAARVEALETIVAACHSVVSTPEGLDAMRKVAEKVNPFG